MNTIKRLLSVSIIGLLIGGALPVQAQQLPPNTAVLNVPAGSATVSFDPNKNPAYIPYTVDGSTAQSVTMQMYQTVGVNPPRQCSGRSIDKVGLPFEGPIEKVPGTYLARWSGKIQNSNLRVEEGSYCYRITWSNAPVGLIQPIDGLIEVNYSAPFQAAPQIGGANGGDPVGGNGGVVGGGLPNGGLPVGGVVNNNGAITVNVLPNPAIIYPASNNTTNNRATFSYTVNQDLPSGYSIYIFQGNTRIKEVYRTGSRVPRGARDTMYWNGRDDAGCLVPAGNYEYRFNVPGLGLVASGRVQVVLPAGTQLCGTPAAPVVNNPVVNNPVVTDPRIPNFTIPTITLPVLPPAISDYGATPNRFYKGESTTVFYRLTQDARVNITVLRDGAPVRYLQTEQYANNGFAGTLNQKFWNGNDQNGYPVNAGTYTVKIDARNNNGVAQTKTFSVIVDDRVLPPPQTDVQITGVSVDRPTFNPEIESNTVRYTLNQAAYVTVRVNRRDSTETVAVIKPTALTAAGSQSVVWTGRFSDANSNYVSAGDYSFVIEVQSVENGSQDRETANVTVTRGTVTPTNVMDVTGVTANPSVFNPETQNTALTFSLNYPGSVTVRVTDTNGNLVKELANNLSFNAGSNQTVIWSGNNQYGDRVANGTYNFRVDAVSSLYGSDYGTGTVTVSRSGNNSYLQITDNGATPNPFNPRTQSETVISFQVNPSPSSVNLRIYSRSDSFIRELSVENLGYQWGNYRARWNGRDNFGNVVADDVYSYRIEANYQGITETRTGSVTVNSYGYNDNYYGDCGRFEDVSRNSSLCEAIDFVVSRGIFVGYNNGRTIGLDRVIERAEFLAVMQKAFRYPLESYSPSYDGDLGYYDLRSATREWFMPYVKTFSRLGLMVGYPDGRMRPERTMSTAELYLVMLKAAKQAPGNIAHFSLAVDVRYAPFIDTPITRETLWYLKYAEFARENGLVKGDRYYPARGITRGQVIKLIYDLHRKGLITFGPAIR